MIHVGISVFKMAVHRLVTPFFLVILCIYCASVSASNVLSQEYLACKTYNTSQIDCSHRYLRDIPILNKNLTTTLDLSHNQLQEIHGAPSKNLTFLVNLNLSYNMISLLNSAAFKGLSSLQELDLFHNRLRALPRGIFSDQFKLVYLDSFV